jgi:hypothetical protein
MSKHPRRAVLRAATLTTLAASVLVTVPAVAALESAHAVTNPPSSRTGAHHTSAQHAHRPHQADDGDAMDVDEGPGTSRPALGKRTRSGASSDDSGDERGAGARPIKQLREPRTPQAQPEPFIPASGAGSQTWVERWSRFAGTTWAPRLSEALRLLGPELNDGAIIVSATRQGNATKELILKVRHVRGQRWFQIYNKQDGKFDGMWHQFTDDLVQTQDTLSAGTLWVKDAELITKALGWVHPNYEPWTGVAD